MDFSQIPPVKTWTAASATFNARARVAYTTLCQRSKDLEALEGEGMVNVALAKLKTDQDPSLVCARGPDDRTRFDPPGKLLSNTELVNAALKEAKATRRVGSDLDGWAIFFVTGAVLTALGALLLSLVFGLPIGSSLLGGLVGGLVGGLLAAAFSDRGDWDMTLRGLIPIVYRFEKEVRPSYDHVLDELLTARGGVGEVRYHPHVLGIGVPLIPETENHILMTETSRYLTNDLLKRRQEDKRQPLPKEGDNDRNGLKEWILDFLQGNISGHEELGGFLKDDFHEYNSRPYQRLSVMALHNLYEFSTDVDVRVAARNVLDYLAAKFAVSSNELRRAAPFRRQPERTTYTPLFGNTSDEETWRFLQLAGNTAVLQRSRHGRVPHNAAGTMVVAALGNRYRVPNLLLDLIISTPSPFWQRLRHEGMEIYAGTSRYLISAGGIFAKPVNILDTSEQALPIETMLLPTADGADRRELVRIQGSVENKPGLGAGRIDTCVVPGFACGMNPQVPGSIPEACTKRTGNWIFLNLDSSDSACALKFGLHIAVYKASCDEFIQGGESAPASRQCRRDAAADDNSSFGFFEVAHGVEPSAMNPDPFGFFVSSVLRLNGKTTFATRQANTHLTQDGRSIRFIINPADALTSGIVDILPTMFEPQQTDIKQWRLADGPRDPRTQGPLWVVQSDIDPTTKEDTGCVVIENRTMRQRLILDLSEPRKPQRSVVSIPSECVCPLRRFPPGLCLAEES